MPLCSGVLFPSCPKIFICSGGFHRADAHPDVTAYSQRAVADIFAPYVVKSAESTGKWYFVSLATDD